MLFWPSAANTTANPSPTGRGSPPVVVTMPSPSNETTVTVEAAASAPSATMRAWPALTGATVPRGVTTSSETWARLSALEIMTSEPELSVIRLCGTGLPAGSKAPPSTDAPMTAWVPGCNSTNNPSAKRSKARPSAPVTRIAPAGSSSFNFEAASVGMPSIFTVIAPSAAAKTAAWAVTGRSTPAPANKKTAAKRPFVISVVMLGTARESTIFPRHGASEEVVNYLHPNLRRPEHPSAPLRPPQPWRLACRDTACRSIERPLWLRREIRWI